jgi:hypothetical protein
MNMVWRLRGIKGYSTTMRDIHYSHQVDNSCTALRSMYVYKNHGLPECLNCSSRKLNTNQEVNPSNDRNRQPKAEHHHETLPTMTRPTSTRGTTLADEWDHGSRRHHANANTFLREVQQVRCNINQAIVSGRTRQTGHAYDSSFPSYLLHDADRLSRKQAAWASYRHEWEGRWTNTAQFWDDKNVGRVSGRIHELMRKLSVCESEAAQLRSLAAEVRGEFRL